MSASTQPSEIQIIEGDFDVTQEYQALCNAAPHSGAVVFFVGLVRDMYAQEIDNERVEYIELSHYPGMTESLCQQIVDEARELFSFDAARVIHRVGKINVGEQIVLVAIASRHRENAFKAAQFIMDYLKTRATLWKKEVGSRGEQWIGIKQTDSQASSRWSSENR